MTLFLSSGKKRPDRKYRVIDSTVQDFCQDYRGEKFHALLCDPPYHLTSITKRFGGANAAPAKFGKDGAFSRASRGFMGQQWDGGDVAFDPDTWAVLAEHLYPGAFIMAFAGTRGYHRMACALEDAGLIIHPAIGWIFGSGFPKATRVPDERFEGHRYGLQSLKPSFEFIAVAQKPYEGRPVDCITATGAGAMWIDGGRIGTEERTYHGGGPNNTKLMNRGIGGTGIGMMDGSGKDLEFTVNGRWPANLALVHDPRCNGSCVPECAVRRLGEQSGMRFAGGSRSGLEPAPKTKNAYGHYDSNNSWQSYEDDGTAARFFHNADWHYEVAEQITNADSVRYEAKASTKERNAGLGLLDSSELVECNQAIVSDGDTQWESTDQKQVTQAGLGTQPERDTTDLQSGIPSLNHQGKSSITSGSGSKQTDQFPQDTKSTTLTKTSRTTDSKTLPLLTLSPTSDSTVGVNSEMVNGGSPVKPVESTSQSIPNTGISPKKDGLNTDDADSATSSKWSSINVHVRREPEKNNHPCIKPIALAEWLAKLLLPPAAYGPRRLLVPFSGSGSEMIGAYLAGWEQIIGIEMTMEYAQIARARLSYYADPLRTMRTPTEPTPQFAQLEMFA